MIRRNGLPQGKGMRKSQSASEPVPPSDRNGGQVGVSSAEKNDLGRTLINENQFSLSIQTTWLCGGPVHWGEEFRSCRSSWNANTRHLHIAEEMIQSCSFILNSICVPSRSSGGRRSVGAAKNVAILIKQRLRGTAAIQVALDD
jgi:hypothetical protein